MTNDHIMINVILVKWDTTPDPSVTASGSSTTLPPGQVYVNGIMYIEVPNPCDMAMDHMCPSKCTRRPSTKHGGTACTQCDCQGNLSRVRRETVCLEFLTRSDTNRAVLLR